MAKKKTGRKADRVKKRKKRKIRFRDKRWRQIWNVYDEEERIVASNVRAVSWQQAIKKASLKTGSKSSRLTAILVREIRAQREYRRTRRKDVQLILFPPNKRNF